MNCHARLPMPPDAGAATPIGRCRMIETTSGEAVDAALFVRAALPRGARVTGPAVIVEDGTSTIVPERLHRAHQRRRRHRDRGDRGMTRRNISEIELQIMWNRLLSVVEEQAQTLVRTAFSTSAREAGDISAGVFDLAGRMLAQAVTGTPGHINTMARSVGHFLDVFPVAQMKEGDVYVTNDPWKGTGHLYDLVVVSPTFMDGRIVALFACTTHLVDMGGVGQTPEGPADLSRGPVHPAAAARARRRDERGPAGDDPRQCARAGAGDRRRLCADRVQRDRQPPPGRDDARIRAARSGHAGRGDHQPQPPGHGGGDRQAAAGHLDRRRCASTATRRRSIWSAR